MHQVIGLILLIGAVSAALFAGTNYGQISGFSIANLPGIRVPDYAPGVTVPDYSYGDPSPSAIQTATAPMTVTYVKPQTPYEYGELVLTADWSVPATGTDIKGWRISSLENEFALPGAQDVYTFGGSVDRLVIRPGDEVRLFSGTSPRGNFRINKCIGYLAEFGNFNPPLEQNCPSNLSEATNYLSNACRSYIGSLSSCETPKPSNISFNDASCHNYMNTINYESCVSKHRGDSDFLEREIWVWVGDNLKYFDQGGDLIRISDKSGKLISQYRY